MGVTQRKGVKQGDGKKSPSKPATKAAPAPPKKKPAPKVKAPAAPKPHTRGRRFVPTPTDRQLVLFMSALGFTQKQIAQQMRIEEGTGGIGVTTLEKYFADELATGLDRATVAVARNLYGMATSATHKSAAICAMFFLKARAGWIDKPERVAVAEFEGAQAVSGLPPPEDGKIVIRLKMEG